MKLPKKIARRDIYNARLFKIFEDDLQFENNRVYPHLVIEHPGAVVVLPQLPNGNFLLVRQYRHSVSEEILEFPAGTLSPDEIPLDCAKREIQEEVGHAAREWTELGLLYPTPGFCNEIQHLYFAKDLYVSVAAQDEDEVIDVVEMSSREIEQAIIDDKFRDGKSLAIYLRAKLKGLIA